MFRPKNPTIFPGVVWILRAWPRAESHFSAVWIGTTSRFLQIKVSFGIPEPKIVLTSIDPGGDWHPGFRGTAQGIVYWLFYNNHGSGKWPFGD